jgi:hypothetical protein
MTDAHPTHGATDNRDVLREPSDVNVRGILWTGAALVAVVIVVHLAAWWLLVVLERQRAASGPPPTPWTERERQLPLPPRLEGIERMEAGDASPRRAPQPPKDYALVDAEAGIVQIPLERAIRLIVEHDLLKSQPARQSAQAASPPSDANSGRRGKEGGP